MTTLYKNSTLVPLTLNGNTPMDQAHYIWYNKLTAMQRYEISKLVGPYKQLARLHRASLNYIAANLEKYA